MSEEKDCLYFSRIDKLGVGEEIFITISDVADAMFTSVRHCRTLLRQMQDRGWLEWSPKVGRNQRSRLYLNYSLDKVRSELAQQLIAKGKYDKARVLVDNNEALFAQLLKNTSGTQQREGRLHIQLTYNRVFSSLLPHKPLRNSERFLVRQVYSCLTKCDVQGNVEPDLAHHWIYDNEVMSWRFFLRPYLRFHNGSSITAQEIVSLFELLKELPIYNKELKHIERIESINPLCVEFRLNKIDTGFAALLSDIKYSIQPLEQLITNQVSAGSGIFQIQESSKQRLTLQAFEYYHGFKALTDTVTIWQLAQQQTEAFADTQLQVEKRKQNQSVCSNYLSVEGGSQKQPTQDRRSSVEDGCLLALINSKSQLSLLQRRYLSQILATDNLMQELHRFQKSVTAVPAYNLLPDWLKILPTNASSHALPNSLSIAIFEHPALAICAEIISHLLERIGIGCNICTYTFDGFYNEAREQDFSEDIILTSMNLDDNRPISAFCWMQSNPILHQSLPKQDREWLASRLQHIRTQPVTSYMHELEPIASALITSYWLLPMFHHQQTLGFEGVLNSVSMNTWGWPEIRDVWVDE